jgi:hypothetical protein
MPKALTGFAFHWQPPLRKFRWALDRFAEEVEDFTPLFDTYNERFKEAMRYQFSTEGVYGLGRRWKHLSPAYAAWKERHYPGQPIGMLTGDLYEGMTGGSGYGYARTQTEASMGLVSGPADVYGGYFSAERPVIRMPAEEALGWYREAHEFVYWAVKEMEADILWAS